MKSIHLICGLDSGDIKNPQNVLRELTSLANDKTDRDELVELANPCFNWEIECELRLLPSLIEPKKEVAGTSLRAFKCKCPRMSVDQQRILHCRLLLDSGAKDKQEESISHEQTLALDLHTICTPISLPNSSDQLSEFVRANRNSVAKKMRLATRLRLYGKDHYNNNSLSTFANERSLPSHCAQEASGSVRDELSLGLYTMEEFLREANTNLADNLALEAFRSALVLRGIWKDSISENCPQKDEDQHQGLRDGQGREPMVMIRAPVFPACVSTRVRQSREQSSDRWAYYSKCCDSGFVDLDWEPDGNLEQERARSGSIISGSGYEFRRNNVALEELLKFRADFRVQSIVRQSVELFGKLIVESPLFKLANNGNNLFTSQELKLYACIECQRLRSSIRFKWITQCLIAALAKEEPQTSRANARTAEAPTLATKNMLAWPIPVAKWGPSCPKQQALEDENLNRLPPIEVHKLEDLAQRKYFDSLAYLMGQLLRQHFLVPALEQWHRLLESHQFVPATGGSSKVPRSAPEKVAHAHQLNKPRMGIRVTLSEAGHHEQEPANGGSLSNCEPSWLVCSRPEEELKETVGFVVDELAAVCRRLPRLETQLESAEPELEKFILTLEADDNLLLEAKRRLNSLIDRSTHSLLARNNERPTNSATLEPSDQLEASLKSKFGLMVGPEPRQRNGWVDSDYLLIVGLVNNFRCGQEPRFSEGLATDANESDYAAVDDRSLRLQVCCRQIRLLDFLEQQLVCRLNRHYDHGFVMLDYGPMRDSLIRCIQKERLLLVRVHSDEILRLMNRVRLHFEEIELGVDFEAAIDGYLTDRRQAKHHQHQQVIMSSEGDNTLYDDGDDEEIVGGENEPKTVEPADSKQLVADEFVEAISQGHSNESHKLLALGGASGEIMMSEARQVVPLIECQLLVGRYEFMSELLASELSLLASDVKVAFDGLVFMSDFVGHEQLDSTHWDLISDLVARSRDFRPMLNHSLARLEAARSRLRKLNELRSQALSRLALEFHLLMGEMGHRLLANELEIAGDEPIGTKSTEADPQDTRRRVVQLDAIQETADWARELELRFNFLEEENSLLAREGDLISGAKLRQSDPSIESSRDADEPLLLERLREANRARASILERWRPLVSALSNLWQLIEEYETQQVKWLNSDVKRIDFYKMDSTYKMFSNRLYKIKSEASSIIQSGGGLEFKLNLEELNRRLEQFAQRRLPLFQFLTNKYLTDVHWKQVAELLSGDTPGGPANFIERRMLAGALITPQACTTLAQFLELNAERYVDRLERINREAIIEQELTNFLLKEVSLVNKHHSSQRKAQLKALDLSGAWFAGWTDQQLVMAAGRFIEAKSLQEQNVTGRASTSECLKLANKLVARHSMVRRYLKLSSEINLDHSRLDELETMRILDDLTTKPPVKRLTLRTCKLLTSAELVSPSLFVEFLRLFTLNWLRGRAKLSKLIEELESDRGAMDGHLADIQSLVDRVTQLRETDLRVASGESEAILVELERETVRLEIEREILATKEALALERQRQALGRRDECIRQITGRAIPAIRAATRALDCLDARSLRTLRYIRPNPPEPVRLVLEAVCLLRSCVTFGHDSTAVHDASRPPKPMEPERHFDALTGRIHEDYWQPTCRMLNGTHSSKLIKDLRRIDKRSIPGQVMRLIRRRYLSSSKFRPQLIERVSPECALLAKWLIAVDVFDRVINVVRPNYDQYLESERKLAALLLEVDNRRRQIESIGVELQRMEECLERRTGLKMSLADSLDQCSGQLRRVEGTRKELIIRRQSCLAQLGRLDRRRVRLANRCLMRAARTVYLDAMRPGECKQMTGLLRRCDHSW